MMSLKMSHKMLLKLSLARCITGTLTISILGFVLSFFTLQALAQTPSDFKQIEESKNISQLLRSNAPHFWSYASNAQNLKNLANYIGPQGVISGDMHLGNMSVIPALSLDNHFLMKFLNVDFDDGGQGPFALEFARFVLVAKASSDEIKIKSLFESYLKGLSGIEQEKPSQILTAESITETSYEARRAKYVAKRMRDEKFIYTPGEIEEWKGSPSLDDVKELFKGVRVLDLAMRPQDRGGSLSERPRLWVLIEKSRAQYHIIELKPYSDTALSIYTPQAEAETRLEDLRRIYWPEVQTSSYRLIKIQNERYWLREKKVEVLEFLNESEEDQARVYMANLMGLTQARQAEGLVLKQKIEQDPEFFKEAVKTFHQEYLTLAKAALGK